MKYRIKVYKYNNIKANIDDDFPKVVAYFQSDFVKQFVDVNIEFDIQTTDVPRQDAPSKIFYPNDGKYNCVMYCYERGTYQDGYFGLTFNVFSSLQGIYLNTDTLDDNVDYTWKSMAHEIIHAISYKVMADRNVVIPNVLDNPIINGVVSPYFGNDNPYLENGNYSQALQALNPYLKELQAPSVILKRINDDGVQTLGELAYNGFSCKTLELTWKDNKPNISCIPKGSYSVKWTFSLRLLKFTYEIQSVPNRSGIRFHGANFFFDLLGCIALGTGYQDINKDGKVDVLNSRITLQKLEDILQRKPFTLKII